MRFSQRSRIMAGQAVAGQQHRCGMQVAAGFRISVMKYPLQATLDVSRFYRKLQPS